MDTGRLLLSSAIIAMVLGTSAQSARADPITVSTTYNFLDNRSANRLGIGTGLRNQFGAVRVVPNGDAGTSATATQGAITLTLPFTGSPATPDQFNSTIRFNPALVGAWTLNFQNHADTVRVTTPSLAGPSALPFVTDVTFSGSGSTPTISWTNPPGIDTVQINIRDFSAHDAAGTAATIHVVFLPAGTTSYTIPSVLSSGAHLALDHRYSIEIGPEVSRNGGPITGLDNVLSRSRGFFEFTPQADSLPAVALPIVSEADGVPVYNFDMTVVEGQIYYIDPLVATGYEYRTGPGNPNFASVLLPGGIGNGLFDLFMWNGAAYFDSGIDLAGGVPYFFGPGGVDRFEIRGIEPSAGLDPNDPMAFITGLTFVASGRFNGTMIPLVSSVPEPGMFALLAVGFAGLGVRRFTLRH